MEQIWSCKYVFALSALVIFSCPITWPFLNSFDWLPRKHLTFLRYSTSSNGKKCAFSLSFSFNILLKCSNCAQVSARTGDESRADDDVHLLTLLGEQLHLCLDELLGHFLGIAALALSRLLDVHLQRLGTQRLELLQGRSSGKRGGGVFLVK